MDVRRLLDPVMFPSVGLIANSRNNNIKQYLGTRSASQLTMADQTILGMLRIWLSSDMCLVETAICGEAFGAETESGIRSCSILDIEHRKLSGNNEALY